MIRRYLPKRTPIAPSMARELQETVDETDNRPMRVLGCRTPPPRHSPTNRQNQPKTRMLHLQIDNGAPADMTDLRYDIRMSHHCYKE